MDLTRQL